MKDIILTIALLICASSIYSQEFLLIKHQSSADWTGYGEIGGFKQVGSIDLKDGSLYMENGQVSSGKIVFNAKSIQNENRDLEKHLKAKDFFFVKKYPEITFVIKSTEFNKVFGELTVRGITLEETFEFEMIQKDDFIIFVGSAKIDRTKYDIKYNSSSYFQDLGNYAIKNEFDLDFRLVFQNTKVVAN